MKTVWLSEAEINTIKAAIQDKKDEVSINISRELSVGLVRADGSRVLNKNFLKSIGKEQAKPFRFSNEEISAINKITEVKAED